MQPFNFKRAEAKRSLTDPDGALGPVNAYSDADELNGLVDDALFGGIIEREPPGSHFAIYPMSLSEPDPQVAVSLGSGPALLGRPVKLREREGESPLEFTLRLLEDLTAEANELAGSAAATSPAGGDVPARDISDREALDALAAKLSEPGEWNGGDLCELAAELLRRSGRPIAEEPDEEGICS
jgi:hypothetical protein